MKKKNSGEKCTLRWKLKQTLAEVFHSAPRGLP